MDKKRAMPTIPYSNFQTVPWNSVDSAIQQAGPLQGKILLTVANPLLPDMSGLLLGTTTSGAEEIAKKAPGALVVEAIPPFAEVLTSSSRRFGDVQPSMFYSSSNVLVTVENFLT